MATTPWMHQHPSSIPNVIDPSQYCSLIHFMEEIFVKYKHLPMYQNMGSVLTFESIDQLSKKFAAYLQQHTKLMPGSHVAIQLPSLLQYPVAVLGILRAGLVVVNINPQYTPHEMACQLQDANTRAIIILENFAHKLAEILPRTAIHTIIVTKVGDLLGAIKGSLLNFTIKYMQKLIPPYSLPTSAIAFKEALKKGASSTFTPVSLQKSDTALLQYTGGTTGIPKGAILTHGNIVANLQQLHPIVRLLLKEKEETVMIPLPLYHIFGFTSLFAMAQIGAKSLLITNPRDISRLIKEWRKYQPTCLIGIHTLLEKLLAHKKFKKLDFSSFNVTIVGGMKTLEPVKSQWKTLTKSKFTEGYGLTECAPVVCTDTLNETIHTPLPSTIVSIADDTGRALPHGTPGELLVQGPQLIKAYWKKEKETQNAFINGWFKTGDFAIMDQHGSITIVDRKKDMINISGFNVYPNEIEQVLTGHPKVLEVGAIGVEAIKVFIVKKRCLSYSIRNYSIL